jgi:predicted aspartyl protease
MIADGAIMKIRLSIRIYLSFLFVVFACLVSAVQADQTDRAGWQRHPVDWRMSGGTRVKAINYPNEKPPPVLDEYEYRQPVVLHKKVPLIESGSRPILFDQEQMSMAPVAASDSASGSAYVSVSVIDSPPIDGFVPWIVVAVTDSRSAELEVNAIPRTSVTGSFLASNPPQDDYAVGIFDTGAGAHVMGYDDAAQTGLNSAYLTSNTVEITGATGSVDAWVSKPLGIFIDGLGACEPNGVLNNIDDMIGETNVSIAVGQSGSDLPTAIGSPLSVYFAANFRNDQQITIPHNGDSFTAPDIIFYDLSDPCIPTYPNVIPLELRPLGGAAVSYFYDMLDYPDYNPYTPSVIIGNQSQSLFFVHSVDLTDDGYSAIDKDRFMFDTGAQITVVGSRVAARLALDPGNPEFEVEIQGVTGETIIAPGFYLDTLDIPALGEWLSFTDIPVVLLDVASPEGGTLDGIIGMNLFVGLNFVLRGGGMAGYDDPSIEFGFIRNPADIAPEGGDGKVDLLDLDVFVEAWLSNSSSFNWDPKCDIAPLPTPDGVVNLLDFSLLSEYWLTGTTP